MSSSPANAKMFKVDGKSLLHKNFSAHLIAKALADGWTLARPSMKPDGTWYYQESTPDRSVLLPQALDRIIKK